jgi:hypothetical protein
MTTVRRAYPALLLLLAAALSSCTVDTATEALKSLGASRLSTTYHSGFWAAEAKRKSPLWEKAQSYCRAPEHADAANCRVIVAVDVTVRVLALRQGEDVSERIRQWIRSGTKELGLPSPDVVPPYVPGKGFDPEPPKMPTPPAR